MSAHPDRDGGRLAGKTAVITGGATGIGLETEGSTCATGRGF